MKIPGIIQYLDYGESNIFNGPMHFPFVAEAVAEILREMLPNTTFNFSGFEDEATMVASLQAEERRSLGCFRDGAGEESCDQIM